MFVEQVDSETRVLVVGDEVVEVVGVTGERPHGLGVLTHKLLLDEIDGLK